MTIDPYAVDTPADEYHERQQPDQPEKSPWFTTAEELAHAAYAKTVEWFDTKIKADAEQLAKWKAERGI